MLPFSGRGTWSSKTSRISDLGSIEILSVLVFQAVVAARYRSTSCTFLWGLPQPWCGHNNFHISYHSCGVTCRAIQFAWMRSVWGSCDTLGAAGSSNCALVCWAAVLGSSGMVYGLRAWADSESVSLPWTEVRLGWVCCFCFSAWCVL